MEDLLSKLGPLAYIGVAVGSTILVLLGRVLGKKSALVAGVTPLLERLKSQIVSYERIDKSVEALLAGYGVPGAFADWVGDCLAGLVTRVPEFMSIASMEQKKDVVVSVFASASKAQIERATLHAIPTDIISQPFAVKRVAQRLLDASADLNKMVRDAGKVAKVK